jgi:hypothetical protein
MAKRKARTKKRAAAGRPKARKRTTKRAAARRPAKKVARKRRAAAKKAAPRRAARLDRARRTLEETVPTPPSSLNMERRPTAARSGRADLAQRAGAKRGLSSSITGGDVDVDLEDAYFTGDEAPGGDNPTPDQDVVDDIGRALGVEYQDNEELKAVDKVSERDRRRWELDPASAEDYRDRK